MKIQNIIPIMLCFAMSIFFVSCSNEPENKKANNIEDGLPISLKIGTQNNQTSLECMMYVFEKSAPADPYLFKNAIELNPTVTTVKLYNHEIEGKYFRFLFLATPEERTELAVFNEQGNAITEGLEWENVLIKMMQDSISDNNYYGILDKTGDEILDEGNINGLLSRLVGHVVFDFYRLGEDMDINNPVDITTDAIASVLDRVYRIDIEYSNPTRGIMFNTDKTIAQEIKETDDVVSITTIPQFLNTGKLKYGVSVPQAAIGLEAHESGAKGAVRIKGSCSLPATDNMKVTLTFHYYDTTSRPACGEGDEYSFDPDCYVAKELKLYYPKNNNEMNFLTVKPNHYTVNKAGLVQNRIIDLGINGTFIMHTDWDN